MEVLSGVLPSTMPLFRERAELKHEERVAFLAHLKVVNANLKKGLEAAADAGEPKLEAVSKAAAATRTPPATKDMKKSLRLPLNLG